MVKEKSTRQLQIVECARQIIILKGIKHLTVREIAKELKITDGALYRHFKSKNEILKLLIDDVEETLLDVIQKVVNRSEDPLSKLQRIFFAHLSYAEQRKGTSFILINEALSIKDKHLRENMYRVVSKYLVTIKGILTEGVKTGYFQKGIDLDSASILFFGAVQSTVTLWGLNGYRKSLNKGHLTGMWNVYKKGVLSKQA